MIGSRARAVVGLVVGLVAVAAVVTAPPLEAAGGERGDWDVGLFGGYGFPDDVGDGEVEDDVLYGARFGGFFTPAWAWEVSAQRLAAQFDVGGEDIDEDAARLNIVRLFRKEATIRPFITAGLGWESLDTDAGGGLEETDIGANFGLGVRWFMTEHFGLRLDGRWASVDYGDVVGDRVRNVEASLGASWTFGGGPPADTDGDGVSDGRDRCPGTPKGALVDERGCPKDADGDGVPDGLDRCPGTPAGTPVDASGCPKDEDADGVHDGLDKCPGTPRGATVDASGCPKDSDGDGVYDGLDRCPNTPAGSVVDANGCPRDSDGDGVYDGTDRCPDTPRGVAVDASGCPKDADGDGVPDGTDRCPDTPKGTKVDAKGCPILFEEGRNTLTLEGVTFDYDSDHLTAAAQEVLNRVAESLREWPEIRVEVAGHTDSKGGDAYNLKLSQRRAEAVRAHLASRGVDAARMTAHGYGETEPVADNKSDAGRAKNRRVELKKK